MASWDIVSKADVSAFVRVPLAEMQDAWYDMAVGLIEEHTGWVLTSSSDIVERIDGNGATYIMVGQYPISAVDQVKVEGTVLPTNYYGVKWDSINLYSYRGEDITLYTGLYSISYIPYGVGNIEVTYDAGGYNSLPNKYKQATRVCIYMIVKEFSTNFRGEGSDQMYKKYRPDRTQNPEEVLLNYGQHGKIGGILNKMLPPRRNFA